MHEKHYSEVPSSWRSSEQIMRELGLNDSELAGKTVLDLGSGGADLAASLKKRPDIAATVISVDPNYNLISTAGDNRDLMTEAVTDLIDENLPAIAGLAEQLPFQNGVFDMVVSNHAFPWHISDNPDQIIAGLTEIDRVLKNGGIIKFNPVTSDMMPLLEQAWLARHNYTYELSDRLLTLRKADLQQIAA